MAAKSSSKLEVHIGKRLRALRKQRGMSLMKLGEVAGVTQQQASRLERAENQITACQLYKFARALDVNVAWFFEGFTDDPAEVERVRTVIQESRGDWHPNTNKELDRELLAAWNALPSATHRRKLLALIEAFAFGV